MPSQAAPSTPAPVETPVVPAPAASTGASSEQTQSDSYTVKRGDTLMKIAFEVYGDVYKWKEIYEANKDKIKDPNFVSNDVVLRVARPATPVTTEQNGEKYLIKKGDTLGRISSSVYGTKSKWKVLWETNKQLIHDPNKIFAGFYLYYNTTNSSPASLASQGNSSSPSTDANSGSSAPRSPSAVPGGEAGSSAAQKNNATAAQSPAAPAAPSALPPTTQESAPAAQAPNSAEAPPVLPPAQPQN
jgi:LysM repeat protein